MNTKLYDYQSNTANDIYYRMSTTDQRGAYLGFDTGTGKTVTSLSVAEKLYKNHMIKGVVVICPVSKVDDWKRDLKYEVPEIEMKFVSSFQSAWREKSKAKIEYVCKMVDALVIVDEGHKMKTYDSKQSKFIQQLSETYKPYMLVLSATPQNKKYIDLYPQYKALGHPLFDIKPKDFKQNYCIEAQNWNLVRAGKARFPFNEIVGYRETEKMDEAVNDYTYYKKYESEYDRPIEIPQSFKMTSDMKYFKEKKVWPRMDEKALLSALESGDDELLDEEIIIANRPTLHHIYMRESCSGFIFNRFLKDNPKLQWLEDFLDGNEGRIVVFTNFINETIVISEVCKKIKRSYCIYDGANKDLTNWNEKDDCVAIVNVVAGCVDGDTEFFTGIGWKKIKDYVPGDKVLQYDENLNSSELVTPIRYIKAPCEDFLELNKTRGIDMTLSKEHQILHTYGRNGKYKKTSANIIADKYNKSKAGLHYKIPHKFNFFGKGIDLSDFEIRLQIAILADGSRIADNGTTCLIFKKKHKADRLQWILKSLGYTKVEKNKHLKKNQYHFMEYDTTSVGHIYKFHLFAPWKEKNFSAKWYNASAKQQQIILNEIGYWDGSVDKRSGKTYCSNVKQDRDYIEFIATSQGFETSSYTDTHRKNPSYVVKISKNILEYYTLSKDYRINKYKKGEIPKFKTVKSKDGYKYCFEVPTHNLVLRKNNCVFVTGNSAGLNDFITTNIAIFFSPPENHIDFEQAKGRIDRIGQTKQPVYYYLQIMNSVEPAIYRNLKEGKDFDDRMFEEWLEKGE